MHRIAKLSLLLAPLMMVSVPGCATPGNKVSHSAPVDTQQARISRLMAVAAEYEKEGKQEAAMRLYQHVLAQQPDHKDAIAKRDLLAHQGINTEDRSLKPNPTRRSTNEALAAATSKTQPSKATQATRATASQDREAIASEVRRKNADLAKMLAAQQAARQPHGEAVEDTALPDEKTGMPNLEEAFANQNDLQMKALASSDAEANNLDWASTKSTNNWSAASANAVVEPASENPETARWQLSSTTQAASEAVANVVETESIANTENISKTDTVAKTENVASVDEGAGWTTTASSEQHLKLASVSSTSKSNSGKAADWQTTDLTQKIIATATKEDDGWHQTRMADLCETLPEAHTPLLAKLESPDPAVRVQGLQEFSNLKSEARGASVAIYSLMEDAEPIVAVNAAGALHQVTGDAWSSVHTLAKYVEHEDAGIAQLAAYLLGQIGPEAMDAVPALERVRNSKSNLTSLYAAEALTHITPADSASVGKLTEALAAANSEVRWFAAVSLGTVAGECEEQAVAGLRQALQDQATDVRVAACLSLGGLGSRAQIAIPDLEKAARSDTPDVRSAAETALACLGRPASET